MTASTAPPPAAFDGEVLRLGNVSKSFGALRALDDVSFTAEPGRVTGLIGANGSGKTTAINLITGFYAGDAGTIELGDRQLRGLSPDRIARLGVRRTFQTPLIPAGLTVVETVAGARYSGDRSGLTTAVLRLPPFRRVARRDDTTARQALRTLGIGHLADERADAQPLGTRRLVEVARVLVANPRLVLLDEPASGLDEREVEHLGVVIRRAARAGATIILVEHNFQMVCDIADHIYVFERGRVIADGDAAAIRSDPLVATTYLGDRARPAVGVAP